MKSMTEELTGEEITALQARLEARREDLAALDRSTAESRKPVALDQQAVGRLSRMDALQAQAMALATERRRQAELGRIEAALARIASGDFGFCSGCDEPIGRRRLELDPTIATCFDCASGAA